MRDRSFSEAALGGADPGSASISVGGLASLAGLAMFYAFFFELCFGSALFPGSAGSTPPELAQRCLALAAGALCVGVLRPVSRRLPAGSFSRFCAAGEALSLFGAGAYAAAAMGGPDAVTWTCWAALGVPCGIGFYTWSDALGGRKRGTVVAFMALACLAAAMAALAVEMMAEPAGLVVTCLLPPASFACRRTRSRRSETNLRTLADEDRHRGRLVLDGVVHVLTQCFGYGLGLAGVVLGLPEGGWLGAAACVGAVAAACALLLADWRGPGLLDEEKTGRYQFAIVIAGGFAVSFLTGSPAGVAGGGLLVAATWACALVGCSTEAESAFAAEMDLSLALSRDWGFSLAGMAMGLAAGCLGFALSREQPLAFPAIMAGVAVAFALLRARSLAPQDMPRLELAPASPTEAAVGDGAAEGDGEGPTPEDGFEARCQAIADAGGLSARQREVMLLLARGRDSKYIQDKLVISRGTADTHIYNIYRKLDIHSKQELIDLVDSG